eukprot:jgi/Botrbrau1/18399/Bobra.0469s0001.1
MVWIQGNTGGRRQTCRSCSRDILEGQEMFPIGGVGRMHIECARAYCESLGQQLEPPVCKHWRHRGVCLCYNTCNYRHPPEDQGTPGGHEQHRRRNWRGREKQRNRFRASFFRRFLLNTFGRETLAAGTGVLDVAGGKGDLSFELLNLNDVPATVVEPRPISFQRFSRWLEAGYYHRTCIFQDCIHVPLPLDGMTVSVRTPAHHRMVMDTQVIDAVLRTLGGTSLKALEPQPCADGEDGNAPQQGCPLASLQASVEQAYDLRWLHSHRTHSEPAGGSSPSGADEDEDEAQSLEVVAGDVRMPTVEDLEERCRCWTGASVIVGMHPDQATDHIVEFAQRTRKPFAVVPCCVHPTYFPDRRLPDGRLVNTYEDYLAFLIAKDPNICAAELPFEGRNTVVYCKSWSDNIKTNVCL